MRAARFALALALVGTPAAARTTGTRTLAPVGVLSRVAHETYGCVDPRAALSMSDPKNPKRADPVWIDFMVTRWQCAKMTPYEPWRMVRHQGPLVLLSAAKNGDQTVPLFVRETELASSFVEPPQGAPPAPVRPPVAPAPMPGRAPMAPAAATAPRFAPPPPLPPPPVTTFPNSIAPGPRYGQGFAPDFMNHDPPKREDRTSIYDAPRNAAEAYADSMRQRGTPWVFLLGGVLALLAIVVAWMLLRRRVGEAHDA